MRGGSDEERGRRRKATRGEKWEAGSQQRGRRERGEGIGAITGRGGWERVKKEGRAEKELPMLS